MNFSVCCSLFKFYWMILWLRILRWGLHCFEIPQVFNESKLYDVAEVVTKIMHSVLSNFEFYFNNIFVRNVLDSLPFAHPHWWNAYCEIILLHWKKVHVIKNKCLLMSMFASDHDFFFIIWKFSAFWGAFFLMGKIPLTSDMKDCSSVLDILSFILDDECVVSSCTIVVSWSVKC